MINNSQQINISIFSKSPLIRGGLIQAFENHKDLMVDGSFSELSMFKEYVQATKNIDLLIMDTVVTEHMLDNIVSDFIQKKSYVKIILIGRFEQEPTEILEKYSKNLFYLPQPPNDILSESISINSLEFQQQLLKIIYQSVHSENIVEKDKFKEKKFEINSMVQKPFHDSLKFNTQNNISTFENTSSVAPQVIKRKLLEKKPQAVAIISSTGGPEALFYLLEDLGQSFEQPIFITQHMPAQFTKVFAHRLSEISNASVFEAQNLMKVKGGNIYIAPGNFHMCIEQEYDQVRTLLTQSPPENFCRPSADPMLRSLANVYSSGLIVIVLTGMGQDGLAGSMEVVKKGGAVIAQDKESSVVWGMPGAVAQANLCSDVLSLSEIKASLPNLLKGGKL